MSYWIKLWTEILDDPKMGQFPDHLWRRVVEMFLFTGKIDGGGRLPSVTDMAWTLHVTPEALEADLTALAELPRPIIAPNGNGWTVCNFADRQAPVSNTERQRRHREQARQDNETVTNCDKPVTEIVTTCHAPSVTQSESESESESDTEKDAPGADAAPAGAPPTPATESLPEPQPEPQAQPPQPQAFAVWRDSIEQSRNRPASLVTMFAALYPGRASPTFGEIGKFARDVGGAGRAAELLWQTSTRPPAGDVLAYCRQVHKNGGKAVPNKREELTDEHYLSSAN